VSTQAFIERFRALHEKAKNGVLSAADRVDYENSRSMLGRLMLVAQQATHSGKTLRAGLRIAQLLKVEIDLGGTPEKTSTMDLASGGFAALLQGSQPVGRIAKVTLHIPTGSGGAQPLTCTAKVASSRQQGALHRVSFTFDALAAADREKLEIAIIDFVLRRFTDPA
jgi:phospho-2-dehydro-3-deoxyheptonate aldolase